LLKEITVKIGLKQEGEEDGIIVEELLDSREIRLIISLEFVKKYKFK